MGMRRSPAFPFVLASCIGASGCGTVSAPSLAPRDVERQAIELPADPREQEAAADPALAGQIAALVDAAVAGDAAFEQARRKTDAAVARAAHVPPGGEAWTVAQQELSALEGSCAPARDAAAAIEALRQEPANAGPAGRAAIDAAAARIEAIEQAEAAALAALAARLG